MLDNKGGYILSKQASEIKISDVFVAVDEKVKTIGCENILRVDATEITKVDYIHDLWDELEDYINNFFQKKTLNDLIK